MVGDKKCLILFCESGRRFPRRLAAQRVDHRILSGDRNIDRGRVQDVERKNAEVHLLVLRGTAHESRHLMPSRQRLVYQRLFRSCPQLQSLELSSHPPFALEYGRHPNTRPDD